MINCVLVYFSYSNAAALISDRYHDQLNTPMETAIHWVEHVAKNRGSFHLQSAGVHLPFYVYYNLDVGTFIAVVFCVVACIMAKLLHNLWMSFVANSNYKQKHFKKL